MAKSGSKLGAWVLGETAYAGSTTIPADASRIQKVTNWNFNSVVDVQETTNSDSFGDKEQTPTLSGADCGLTVYSDGYDQTAGIDGQVKLDEAHEAKEIVKLLLVTETTRVGDVFSPKVGAMYRVVNVIVTSVPDDVAVEGVMETAFGFAVTGKSTRGKVQ